MLSHVSVHENYSVRLAFPFMRSGLVTGSDPTDVSTGLFPKCPECRVAGTTRKPRRNEFVPKLSSKQNVEYLTHVTLQ